jgi:hypothetical protein
VDLGQNEVADGQGGGQPPHFFFLFLFFLKFLIFFKSFFFNFLFVFFKFFYITTRVTWQFVQFWTEKWTEVLCPSFSKIHLPYAMRIETQVSKNKVSKPHAPKMHLTL